MSMLDTYKTPALAIEVVTFIGWQIMEPKTNFRPCWNDSNVIYTECETTQFTPFFELFNFNISIGTLFLCFADYMFCHRSWWCYFCRFHLFVCMYPFTLCLNRNVRLNVYIFTRTENKLSFDTISRHTWCCKRITWKNTNNKMKNENQHIYINIFMRRTF